MPNEIKLLTEEDCKDIDVFLDGCVPPDYDPCGTTYDWLHRAMETIRRLQLDLRHQTGRADLAEARMKEKETELKGYRKYDIKDILRLLDRLEAHTSESLAHAEKAKAALNELIEAGIQICEIYHDKISNGDPDRDRPFNIFYEKLRKAENVGIAKEAHNATT